MSDKYYMCRQNLTKDEFVSRALVVHIGSSYDYSKVLYKNYQTKVIIGCQAHGEFLQTPSNHLKGKGCPLCGNTKRANKHKVGKEEFITRAESIHGRGTYDYSLVVHRNAHTKVCIICKIHGASNRYK